MELLRAVDWNRLALSLRERRVIELHVGRGWHPMKSIIEHVCCHFARCTLSAEDSAPKAGSAKLPYKVARVVRCKWLFVIRLKDCDIFSVMVLKKVGAARAIVG